MTRRLMKTSRLMDEFTDGRVNWMDELMDGRVDG